MNALTAFGGKAKLMLGAMLLALALIVWLDGIRSEYVPCSTNCGETFDAMQYVDNFKLYGMRFGLMQDMATGPEPESRPFLYTHNVNLGGLVFTAAEALGISSLAGKQLITLAAFLGGLIYVYLTVLLFTRSTVTSLITIALLALDYVHVASYGLNALRAWHWIALFGPIFHVARLCAIGDPASSALNWGALVATATVAFGIGYDFFAIVFFTTITSLVLLDLQADFRRRIIRVAAVITCFCLPFVVRQLHVVAALGMDYWWRDFSYSVLIKIPYVSFIAAPLNLADVDAFYARWNVLRPPAAPAQSIGEILNTLGSMITHVTLPDFGLIAVATLALAVLGGICHVGWNVRAIRSLFAPLIALALVALLAGLFRPRSEEFAGVIGIAVVWFAGMLLFPSLLALTRHPRLRAVAPSSGAALAWSIAMLALALMPLVMHRSTQPALFGRYSLAYLGALVLLVVLAVAAVWAGRRLSRRLEGIIPLARYDCIFADVADRPFDLLGASRLMAILGVGIVLGLAIFAPFSFHVYLKHQFPLIVAPMYVAKALLLTVCLWGGACALRQRHRVVMRALAGFLVIDFAVVTAATLHALQPISTDWFDAVKARAQSTFAVSWIPNSVSVITDDWVVGVRPDLTRTFIDRLTLGREPFREGDLFLFGERDASVRMDEYLTPDYWLYFPIDQTSPFDASEPSCRRDWISAGLVRLVDWNRPRMGSVQTWVSPGTVAPGSQALTGGRLTVDRRHVGNIELVGPRVLQWVSPDLDGLYRSVEMGPINYRLQYRCVTSSFLGRLTVAPDASEGYHIYAFHLVSPEGKRTVIGGVIVDVRNEAAPSAPPLAKSLNSPTGQPTVSEILRAFDQLPIAAWGKGYVLFDLRRKQNASNP